MEGLGESVEGKPEPSLVELSRSQRFSETKTVGNTYISMMRVHSTHPARLPLFSSSQAVHLPIATWSAALTSLLSPKLDLSRIRGCPVVRTLEPECSPNLSVCSQVPIQSPDLPYTHLFLHPASGLSLGTLRLDVSFQDRLQVSVLCWWQAAISSFVSGQLSLYPLL